MMDHRLSSSPPLDSPVSCDTFVIMPSGSANRTMIFGKNSDRPQGEVQEIVYVGRQQFEPDSKQKCTYISVHSIPETYSTILSKPAWMWGAEMGSNEFGVCIGNEAIWNRFSNPGSDLEPKKLLGMDMVRLALERSKTASEALQIITELLKKYGQGGPCSDRLPDLCYHNGFMIVDPGEAWILETVGEEWAAELVTGSNRNISNCLSIGTKIDRMSDKLKSLAQDSGLWDGVEPFNFTKVYSCDGDNRQRLEAGKTLLDEATKDSNATTSSMIDILRNKDSDICRDCSNQFPTTSSQVSVMTPGLAAVHWFTGTPDPQYSCFKPFIFDPTVEVASLKTISPSVDQDTEDGQRKHVLYRKHEEFYGRLQTDTELWKTLRQMEQSCINELEQTVLGPDEADVAKNLSSEDIATLFGDAVESELRFYR